MTWSAGINGDGRNTPRPALACRLDSRLRGQGGARREAGVSVKICGDGAGRLCALALARRVSQAFASPERATGAAPERIGGAEC